MATKDDLQTWVIDALEKLGGSGSVIEVSRMVWDDREQDLRGSGDLFYTWQYDIRWAAQKLRDAGRLKQVAPRSREPWTLS